MKPTKTKKIKGVRCEFCDKCDECYFNMTSSIKDLQQENAELKRYNTLYFDNNIKSLREVKRLRQALEKINKVLKEDKR